MFLRNSTKANKKKSTKTTTKDKMKRLLTKKPAGPKKYMKMAFAPDAMKGEYFRLTTHEEAEEIDRILKAKNYFEVLEVDHKQTLVDQEDELRRSYLSKTMLLNPNKCDHPELDKAFAKLCRAYDCLKDPENRLEHKYEHFGGRPQAPDSLGALLHAMLNDGQEEDAEPTGQPRLLFARPPPRGPPMIVRRQAPPMFAGPPGGNSIFSLMDRLLNDEDEEQEEQPQNPPQQQRQARTGQPPAQQTEQNRTDSDEPPGLDSIIRNMFGPPPQQRRQAAPQGQQGPPRSLFDLMFAGLNEDEEENGPPPRRQMAPAQGPRILQGPGGVRFLVQPPGGMRQPQQGRTINAEDARRQFAQELTQLNEMGFTDEHRNIRALVASRGNVDAAVNMLVA